VGAALAGWYYSVVILLGRFPIKEENELARVAMNGYELEYM